MNNRNHFFVYLFLTLLIILFVKFFWFCLGVTCTLAIIGVIVCIVKRINNERIMRPYLAHQERRQQQEWLRRWL